MAYVPDANNAAEPLDSRDPSTAAAEFRALKAKVNALSPTTPVLTAAALANVGTVDARTEYAYTVSGTTATISHSAHPYVAGTQIALVASTGTLPSGIYTIATVATNTYTVTVPSGTTNGNVREACTFTQLTNCGVSYVSSTTIPDPVPLATSVAAVTVKFTFASGLFPTGVYVALSGNGRAPAFATATQTDNFEAPIVGSELSGSLTVTPVNGLLFAGV